MVSLGNDWDDILQDEFKKDYYLQLREFLKQEYARGPVYPNMYNIFNALKYTAFKDVKAVILGQDPYHGPGQAHGLCFSVNDGVQFPPSLVNIFKEIKADIGTDAPTTGNLTRWAEQGVLLLNATLTVPSRFSSKPRLGDIYRRRYSCPGRKQGAPGVYLMGLVRSKEGSFH